MVLFTRVGVINVSKDLVDVVLLHHFEELVVIAIININTHDHRPYGCSWFKLLQQPLPVPSYSNNFPILLLLGALSSEYALPRPGRYQAGNAREAFASVRRRRRSWVSPSFGTLAAVGPCNPLKIAGSDGAVPARTATLPAAKRRRPRPIRRHSDRAFRKQPLLELLLVGK